MTLVNDVVVLVSVGGDYLPVHHGGELPPLIFIAILQGRHFDGLHTFLETAAVFLQRQLENAPGHVAFGFQRLDDDRPLVAHHREMPALKTLRLGDAGPDRGQPVAGKLQNGQPVVEHAVGAGAAEEGADFRRLAHERHDEVNQMAGKNVMNPTLVGFDELPVAGPVIPSHGRVEIEHVSDQAVFHSLDAELHGRVVPIHVAHLDRQAPGFRLVQQLPELRQRLATRLVQMNVLPRPDAVQRGRDGRVLLRLHRHGLKTGHRQQLARGHPSQPPVAVALQRFRALRGIILRDTDHLEKIRQSAQRPDFVGVLIARADLSDFDRLPLGAKHALGGKAARQGHRRRGKPGGGDKCAS